MDDPGLQDQPLGGREPEEADGVEGEPPGVLQAGARLAQVQEGDVVQEGDLPGDVPQDLEAAEAAGVGLGWAMEAGG